MPNFVLALDQGTTGSAALIFNAAGQIVASADLEITQSYPQPGWVEHDPNEIFATTVAVAREVIAEAGISAREIAAIGIANQRETTIVWERSSSRPIYPAVVWQSRVSAEICERLKSQGCDAFIHDRTGLLIDAYFSATKLRWILDRVPGAQARSEAGELLFGTVDSWLVWKLTGGRAHITDVSNASRTMLLDLDTRQWDDDLLELLGIPRAMLPTIVSNSSLYAETGREIFGVPIPIAGMAGDQQAALFGQACFDPGEAKNTYGTGCFLLTNTGATRQNSDAGLLTTVAWDIGDGPIYALEGSAFITGAAVQWLRDGLGIIHEAAETETLAHAVPDNGGVYFVPAFAGLGAPVWDMYARGVMLGITGGTTRQHIARATLESIAYQTRDLAEAMKQAGQTIETLHVDGGGTANAFLMQFQADILGVPVEVSDVAETTARGAAFLAGLAVQLWTHADSLRATRSDLRRFEPTMSADQRDYFYSQWKRAVERSKAWTKE